MNVNVTPEVADAHKELRKQCEKFETAVDDFCSSLPQSLTHGFYGSECVPIAPACADALLEFANTRSHEDAAYKKEIQNADSQAKTRIREAEKNIEEIKKLAEKEIQNADSQAKTRIRESEEKVEEIKKLAEKEIQNAGSRTKKGLPMNSWVFLICYAIGLFVMADTLSWSPDENFLSFIFFPCIVYLTYCLFRWIIIFSVVRTSIPKIRENKDRAVQLAEDELKKVVSVQNAKVADAHEKARTKKNQAEDELKKVVSVQNAKVADAREKARTKKNQAIAYIEQERSAFDKRLCQCLDKLQSFIDAYIENVNVPSVLNKSYIQNLGENGKRISPRLTRVGTAGVWAIPQALLKKAEVYRSYSRHESALRDAEAEMLLKGVDVQSQDESGRTPLHIAARENDSEVAEVLIQQGADPNAKNNDGWTPLHTAAVNNAAAVAEVLIQQGGRPQCQKRQGQDAATHGGVEGCFCGRRGVTPSRWPRMK